jgi:hypothetical protein
MDFDHYLAFAEKMFAYPILLDIIPSYADSFEDQVACIIRFFVYLGVALIVLGRGVAGLFALVIGAALGYILLLAPPAAAPPKMKEDFRVQTACRRPTPGNPFMNRLPYDAVDLPGACDLDEPGVRRETTRLFDENLYRDVGDVFHTVSSDRQYYTMPTTSVVNDSVGFAHWLYGSGGRRTCKEDTAMCGHF